METGLGRGLRLTGNGVRVAGIKFYGNESAKSGNVTAEEGGGAITEHVLSSFLAPRRGIQMRPGLEFN